MQNGIICRKPCLIAETRIRKKDFMNKNDRMTMMAELPVHTVLLKMSIPMMISFFIQAMYNIVDSMFVARISESALTAVSLAFPMQQIVTAISVGLSTGVSAVWSRYMGMNEPEKARRWRRSPDAWLRAHGRRGRCHSCTRGWAPCRC